MAQDWAASVGRAAVLELSDDGTQGGARASHVLGPERVAFGGGLTHAFNSMAVI